IPFKGPDGSWMDAGCGALIGRAYNGREGTQKASMDFELAEEHRMLADLVGRFVDDELMPLEGEVLAQEAKGGGLYLPEHHRQRIDEISKRLGLHGLDAPED